jgi:hypothetical protein
MALGKLRRAGVRVGTALPGLCAPPASERRPKDTRLGFSPPRRPLCYNWLQYVPLYHTQQSLQTLDKLCLAEVDPTSFGLHCNVGDNQGA